MQQQECSFSTDKSEEGQMLSKEDFVVKSSICKAWFLPTGHRRAAGEAPSDREEGGLPGFP